MRFLDRQLLIFPFRFYDNHAWVTIHITPAIKSRGELKKQVGMQ